MPTLTFTVPESAAVLGVGESEVRRLVLAGHLRCVGTGPARTVCAGDLLDCLGSEAASGSTTTGWWPQP